MKASNGVQWFEPSFVSGTATISRPQTSPYSTTKNGGRSSLNLLSSTPYGTIVDLPNHVLFPSRRIKPLKKISWSTPTTTTTTIPPSLPPPPDVKLIYKSVEKLSYVRCHVASRSVDTKGKGKLQTIRSAEMSHGISYNDSKGLWGEVASTVKPYNPNDYKTDKSNDWVSTSQKLKDEKEQSENRRALQEFIQFKTTFNNSKKIRHLNHTGWKC